MRTSHIIVGAAMMVALGFGCSKSPGGTSPAAISSEASPTAVTNATATHTNVIDLELSTKTPTQVTLDSTNDCTITTTALQDGQFMLTIDIKAAESVKPTPPIKMVISSGNEFTLRTKSMAAPLRFRAKFKAE